MYIIVLITTKNTREARKISDALVKEKLVACANIIKDIRSVFWWQGAIDSCSEALLILKTQRRLFKKIEKMVMRLHSYESPEIIALPIVAGRTQYLRWIDDSIR